MFLEISQDSQGSQDSWSRPIDPSWPYVFKTSSKPLQDIFKTPCKNVFKTSSRRLARRFEDVFKTPSRHIQHVFKTFSRRIIKLNCSCSWPIYSSWPYLFKTSSRRLPKMFSRRLQKVFKISSRRLQDVFKTNHQVKLFLLTRFQDVFETYSKRFWDVLQRRLSIEGFA